MTKVKSIVAQVIYYGLLVPVVGYLCLAYPLRWQEILLLIISALILIFLPSSPERMRVFTTSTGKLHRLNVEQVTLLFILSFIGIHIGYHLLIISAIFLFVMVMFQIIYFRVNPIRSTLDISVLCSICLIIGIEIFCYYVVNHHSSFVYLTKIITFVYLALLYIVITITPSVSAVKKGYYFLRTLVVLLLISVIFSGYQVFIAFYHYHKGMAYADADDSIKAVRELNKFINMKGGVIIHSLEERTYNKLGDIYAAQGLLDGSIRYYEKSLAEDDKNLTTHYNLGMVLQKKAVWEKAAKQFEFVAERNPDYLHVYEKLAEVYISMGEWDKLTEFIWKNEIISGKLIDWLKNKVCSETVISPKYHYALYLAYKTKGEMKKATAELHRAAQFESDFIDAYYELGLLFMEEQKLEEAIKEFKKAIAVKSESVTPLYLLASCFEKIGEIEQAVENYEKVASLVPACQDVKIKLKELYQESGLMDKISEIDKQIPGITYGNNGWEFDTPGVLQGWIPRWQLKSIETTEGSLKLHAAGEEPYIEHFGLDISTKTYHVVSIRMKLKSESRAFLFWVTSNQSGSWRMSMYQGFGVIADDNYHIYNLDMKDKPLWDGIVTQLRLDFENVQVSKDDIQIDYIKFGYI